MKAPKPKGIATTKEGKQIIFERTRQLVDNSSTIFVVPVEGVECNNLYELRKKLPPSTKATVIKSGIFKRVIEGTKYDQLADHLKNNNIYFFISEGEVKTVLNTFQRWRAEIGRFSPEYDVRCAIFEQKVYSTPEEIKHLATLPTREECIVRVIQSLKAVPTRFVQVLNHMPERLVRVLHGMAEKRKEMEANGTASATATTLPAATSVAAAHAVPSS
jgi:large subunit ribosomal protein L10